MEIKEYTTVKWYFVSAAFWFALGTTAGFIDATHMMAPDLLDNIPFLVFGRVRPMHTNLVIFGFVGTMLIGSAHYILPTLCRAKISEKLGLLSLALWNAAVLSGTITLGLGYSQGREYAEWIWPVDITLLLSLLVMTANLAGAAINRKEETLYVSSWYILATLVFIFGTYLFGNAVWNPSTGAITGLPDAQLAWFYGHSLVGLFLTSLAIAVSYYVIPIVARAPLFSHTLSLIGFWSILVLYNSLGAHHLLQTPIPDWLKVMAITNSIAMFVPVYIVLINLWLTARGRLGYIHEDTGGKFVMAGLVWYLLVCTQGPLQALPIVQRVTHLNNWTIGHAHLGVLGFSGTIALGGMWFIVPRITGRPLYSSVLADVQYWLVLLGMAGFLAVLTVAGLVQGNSWRNGEAVVKTLPQIHSYMILRAMIGLLIVGGSYIGLYNLVRSIWGVRYPVRESVESGALP